MDDLVHTRKRLHNTWELSHLQMADDLLPVVPGLKFPGFSSHTYLLGQNMVDEWSILTLSIYSVRNQCVRGSLLKYLLTLKSISTRWRQRAGCRCQIWPPVTGPGQSPTRFNSFTALNPKSVHAGPTERG